MKIAIVGAGIFGCIAALKLRQRFPRARIHVYDRHPDIFREASGINQYRLHEGYHYPRSPETVEQCLVGIESFLTEYHNCTVTNVDSQYCIAKENSLISGVDYLRFLTDHKLPYYEPRKQNSNCLNYDNIDTAIWVNEQLLDIVKFKFTISEQLRRNKIAVILNTEFDYSMSTYYKYVINCTYSNLNSLLDENDRINYQFELCEKPVIELPVQFKKKSFVVLDGPFMCIDPLGDTQLHVMGHVKHAIHHTNVGKFPEIPEEFEPLMNIGITVPKITNFSKFCLDGQRFFNNFNPKHIGSMYTIRTVLPNREEDDARPSYVTRHNEKLYSIFSGKISTAVEIANQLIKML